MKINKATIIVNERTTKGKSLMEFLRKFEGEGFLQLEKEPNAVTKRAIQDVKKNKVTRCESFEDMMNKLNS